MTSSQHIPIFPATAALILAGGNSSRMGEDKALLKINGKPLIQIIHDQLHEFFDEIVVSTNSPEKYNFLGLPMVKDELIGSGPLMGLYSSFKKITHPIVFVCACDIPIINNEFLRNMFNTIGVNDAVVPRHNSTGKVEPLFAFYRKTVQSAIEQALVSGRRRVTGFYKYVNVNYFPLTENFWYFNLNDKADLEMYLQ